ncbi:ABC transporter ATP-binding protein [Candidatus Bathyarchaeota archaeon]|nr:MAG: ABC transporter ATP-binding protein [Candidatus Bathyarchaeota archaeon]
MKALLSLYGITKKYREITALNGVNLEILEKDLLAIIGPNGAGKTTMLKIMAGIETPTKGKIIYKGRQITHNFDVIRRNFTMVFQKTVVFNTTVFNNVAYGLKIRGIPKNEIKSLVDEALELVKLEGYENRQAKKLSGGEQQRVALARALVLRPEMLLLDEPTANLDPKTKSIIEEVINYANRELGTTVVIATHNMFQVQKIAKKAALILNGRIIEKGTIEEIFLKPSLVMTNFAGFENVFVGNAKPTGKGTALIELGNGLEIEAAIEKSGKVTVYVRPEDVIVSKIPLESSARNVLKGRIIEVSDSGQVVRLKVDAGKVITSQITRRSFEEMKLNVGTEVFLTFKASSVHVA